MGDMLEKTLYKELWNLAIGPTHLQGAMLKDWPESPGLRGY
jgi:hypothetical protein